MKTTIGSPPRPAGEFDVSPERVAEALRIRREFAARIEPQDGPECAHCGDRHGPLVPEPHQARYASGARVLVCEATCTPADRERHDIDPADPVFATSAAAWVPATDADYGTEWAAWLADRTAASDTAWAAAHTETTGETS